MCERLLPLAPHDPQTYIVLGGAYLENLFPALALQHFQRMLRRWPTHHLAFAVQDNIRALEAMLREVLPDIGLSFPEDLELAALHDEVQRHFNQGRYSQVIAVGEQLLQRRRDFVPTRNNMSEAYFRTGQSEQALANSQRGQFLDRRSKATIRGKS